MSKTIVAIPADTRSFDGYAWHATPTQYIDAALDGADALPLLLPAFENGVDVDPALDRIDGVLISGSRSNVHPSLYGQTETEAHGPFDRARDATSLELIRRAIARGIPLLAVCRGIQELNVALGGTLATEIQSLPGRIDHRKPESDDTDISFAIRHSVTIEPHGRLAEILGGGDVAINSLHRQAIDELAPGLRVEARAEDGTVEGVSVIDAPGFAIGVQWHPEYWVRSDGPSAALFKAFGDATRAYAGHKSSRMQAAE